MKEKIISGFGLILTDQEARDFALQFKVTLMTITQHIPSAIITNSNCSYWSAINLHKVPLQYRACAVILPYFPQSQVTYKYSSDVPRESLIMDLVIPIGRLVQQYQDYFPEDYNWTEHIGFYQCVVPCSQNEDETLYC